MRSYRLSVLRFSFLFSLVLILTPAAWGEVNHVVKRGESLYTIARKYQCTPSKIQKANGLQDINLQLGQRLAIPTSQSSRAAKTRKEKNAGPPSNQKKPEIHVVKKGETLSGIAHRYHIQSQELREINELRTNRLVPGQKLILKRSERPDQGANPPQETEPVNDAAAQIEITSLTDDAEIPKFVEVVETMLPSEEKEGTNLVRVAQAFLGVKYRRGGSSLLQGLDCSAYVQKVFQVVGVDLPRTAREQFGVGLEVARDALRLGDLVFFKPGKAQRVGHVGIYIGNGQFIHTSQIERKVNIDNLNNRYFSARFIGARRIEEPKKPDTASPFKEMQFTANSSVPFSPVPFLHTIESPDSHSFQ